jgi:hypothetical protein
MPVNARIRIAPAILHIFNSYTFSLRTENGINAASKASFFGNGKSSLKSG